VFTCLRDLADRAVLSWGILSIFRVTSREPSFFAIVTFRVGNLGDAPWDLGKSTPRYSKGCRWDARLAAPRVSNATGGYRPGTSDAQVFHWRMKEPDSHLARSSAIACPERPRQPSRSSISVSSSVASGACLSASGHAECRISKWLKRRPVTF
jgi:hypothetical protein